MIKQKKVIKNRVVTFTTKKAGEKARGKKKLTSFRTLVLTRHPSHSPLRVKLPLLPFRSVLRLGSTTPVHDGRVELNSVQGVKNSSNKLLMKQCFKQANIKTANWGKASDVDVINDGGIQFSTDINGCQGLEFPIVAKSHYGSRGEGNTLIRTKEAFNNWKSTRILTNYILEKFLPFKYEYRFHTNKNGVFYVCRKALMEETPKEKRWMMNSQTCVWYLENNEKFYKPSSFETIKQECVKALYSLGLDFCAFDIRVQSETDSKGNIRNLQDFFIIEGNSAPSLQQHGLEHYLVQIPLILKEKHANL